MIYVVDFDFTFMDTNVDVANLFFFVFYLNFKYVGYVAQLQFSTRRPCELINIMTQFLLRVALARAVLVYLLAT